jgi:ATP adenylyltransferase
VSAEPVRNVGETTDHAPAAGRLDANAASDGTAAQALIDDGLDRLWAPHRLAYVQSEAQSTDPTGQRCPFCLGPDGAGNDLVVARGDHVFAVLNRYPYNPGHLLVCPYRHVADYPALDAGETEELARFTQTAMRAIRATSDAHGFNIGMNLGAVAGAGVAAHLHQHVVPRWRGDTNFMPVVGRTKVLPQLLEDTRDLLGKAWVQV